MPRHPPLIALHEALGATLGEDRGWTVPLRYDSPERELAALREAAGVMDASDRGLVLVTGSERIEFLQGQLSNDIKALAPGGGCRATLLTRTGKLVSDLGVAAFESCHALDMEPDRAEPTRAALDRFLISEDAELEDATGAVARLIVAGPEAARLVSEATGLDAAALQAWEHRALPSSDPAASGIAPRLARRDTRGLTAFELWLGLAEAPALWRRLIATGATGVGRDAWELAGLEAGEARFGLDMDESTNPLEVHLQAAISYTKGCYVGQEVIAKATHLGRVGKVLVGLAPEGDTLPPPGTEVLADGEVVGRVTRSARSPTLARSIALAIVKRKQAEAGTRVALRAAASEATVPAEVVALPFVAPPS